MTQNDERHEGEREAVDPVTVLCDSIVFAASSEASVGHRTKNQIARVGTFNGHPQGAFELSPAVFEQMVANFNATMNRMVPVDYEHLSERVPESAARDGVPAPAWIVGLENRGADGLWADFEWVDDKAVEYVRSGKYRFVSPAIVFGAKHRETGKPIGARLTSVALTNHPFLDGMATLVAADRQSPQQSTPTPSEGTHLDDSAPASQAPVVAQEQTPMEPDESQPQAPAPNAAAPQPIAAPGDDGARIRERLVKMGTRLGMSGFDAEGAEDAIMDRIEKLIEDFEAVQRAEAEQAAQVVVSSGRADASAKPSLVALFLSHRSTFDAIFARPPVAPEHAPIKASEVIDKAVLSTHIAPAKVHMPITSAGMSDEDKMLADARSLSEKSGMPLEVELSKLSVERRKTRSAGR